MTRRLRNALREWFPVLPLFERRRGGEDTGQRRRLTDGLSNTLEIHEEAVRELSTWLDNRKPGGAE